MKKLLSIIFSLSLLSMAQVNAQDHNDSLAKCNQGNAKSCIDAGKNLEENDLTKAYELFSKSCTLNDAEGCFNEARTYEFLAGEKLDSTKLLSLLEKSYSLWDANGCIKLGDIYQYGQGVPEDLKKALDCGEITRADLELCAKRILEMIMKLD